MSFYWNETDYRRQAQRDFDRGRRDRDYYDRYAWDGCKEAYTQEYDRLAREAERRREEQRYEEEQEWRRAEAVAEERRRQARWEEERRWEEEQRLLAEQEEELQMDESHNKARGRQ